MNSYRQRDRYQRHKHAVSDPAWRHVKETNRAHAEHIVEQVYLKTDRACFPDDPDRLNLLKYDREYVENAKRRYDVGITADKPFIQYGSIAKCRAARRTANAITIIKRAATALPLVKRTLPEYRPTAKATTYQLTSDRSVLTAGVFGTTHRSGEAAAASNAHFNCPGFLVPLKNLSSKGVIA